MLSEPIRKRGAPRVPPNMPDYDRARRDFSWDRARADLSGLPGSRGLNIAYEAVDRHAYESSGDVVALRCVGRDDGVTNLTYEDLRRETNRFANVLCALGIGRGDRVFSLLGRVPELYVTVLGTLKNVSVLSPLFSAFGPEPICERLRLGDARLLVTSEELYRRKIAGIRDRLPGLKHVLIVGDAPEGTLAFHETLAAGSDAFDIPDTDPEDMALLHFTSGTTGRPKGAVHVHDAVVAHYATARFALDLHHDDVFWCTADPGWVTGMSYGVIAPLACGLTMVTDAGEFDTRRWYRVLAGQGVTVWYTAPTAIRMLMRHGAEIANDYDLSALRFVASVGEPLNPEAVGAFADGWYLTGDIAYRDADGYLWFVARADDVIKSAGHLIGPFEVESVLMEHPAVAEAGVIGKPDPVAGEIVKAFVALKPGHEASEELRRELIAFGRRRLGAVAAREITFDQDLPHTRSGKVMRRVLKARELGLPEGDVSTLERPS